MGIAESALEAAHGTDGSAAKDHFSIAGGLLIFWCGTAAGGLPNFVTWSLFVPQVKKRPSTVPLLGSRVIEESSIQPPTTLIINALRETSGRIIKTLFPSWFQEITPGKVGLKLPRCDSLSIQLSVQLLFAWSELAHYYRITHDCGVKVHIRRALCPRADFGLPVVRAGGGDAEGTNQLKGSLFQNADYRPIRDCQGRLVQSCVAVAGLGTA